MLGESNRLRGFKGDLVYLFYMARGEKSVSTWTRYRGSDGSAIGRVPGKMQVRFGAA